MPHIETSDKSVIFGYHRKPTVKEDAPEDLYCHFHNPPVKKIQCGRYWHCPACKGRIKLVSGKPIK